MGGSDSKETETIIKNEIDIEIKNETENITRIMNESVTNSSMTIINTNAQEMDAKIGAANVANLGELNIGGEGNDILIEQEASVDSIAKATMNLTQNNESANKLATQINTDLMNKIQNDSSLKQSLQAATNLKSEASTAGGLNDMIKNVTDMVGKMVQPGQNVSENQKTEIKNSIKNSISNRTVNENDIKNIITSNINNTIDSRNLAACKSTTNANNEMNLDRLNVKGKNNKVKIGQSVTVKAAVDCIIGAAQTNKIVNDIVNSGVTTAKTDTTNKTVADQGNKADTTITKKTETKAAFEDMIASFNPFKATGNVVIAVVLCCFCISVLIGLMMYLKSQGKSAEN